MSYSIIHKHFDKVDSTQDLLKAEAIEREGLESELLVITAGIQELGRGVKGDKWISPSNCNFLGSFGFLLPKKRNTILRLMPIIGALSVRDLLNKYKVDSQLKWVNDVLVDGKKISGVLVENLPWKLNPDLKLCVVGIGININMTQDELSLINQPSTSLSLVTNQEYDIDKIKKEFIDIFKKNIEQI
jgi:BirA family biotin operon repressor/biotin-[acetyl-CoA-carboxylase] ligase